MPFNRRTFLTAAAATAASATALTPATASPLYERHENDTPRLLDNPFDASLKNPAPEGWAPKSPLARAHAHNDYLHEHPLWDALEQGFCSVEADVWFEGGQILLGHTRLGVLSGRSLEEYYVKPLAALVRANGGHVFPGYDGPFQLLIDIKDQGEKQLPAIEQMLAPYSDVFWHVNRCGEVVENPVRVVYTGGRPFDLIKDNPERFGSADGHLGDLGGEARPLEMPLISESWSEWGWQGFGERPGDQFRSLKEFSDGAHAMGARSRLWGAPSKLPKRREILWQMQLDAGIDLINADHLPELRAFLLERGAA